MNVLLATMGDSRQSNPLIARIAVNQTLYSSSRVFQSLSTKLLSAFIKRGHRLKLLPQDFGTEPMPECFKLVRSMPPCWDIKNLVEFF